MVYVSMNNFAGCIEGATVNTGASDLKSRNSERFDARLHGAGINDEENAGQRSNTGATVWWTPWSGGLQGLFARVELKSTPHWSRNHGNPCAEKGMHTRPQQIFSSRSRMGKRESDAHVRGAAVAQRLHSAIFGGGETRHENAKASKAGGSMKSRHPASNLFMKKLLLLLPLLLSNTLAQDGSFNGTVYDLDSGRIQVISGSVDIKPKEDTYLSTLRRINAELAESNARLDAEITASRQLYELRRQTRLLEEIANK